MGDREGEALYTLPQPPRKSCGHSRVSTRVLGGSSTVCSHRYARSGRDSRADAQDDLGLIRSDVHSQRGERFERDGTRRGIAIQREAQHSRRSPPEVKKR